MSHFDEALTYLLWAEGGLKEDPPGHVVEAGGAANFGITVVAFLEWKHKKGELKHLRIPDAKEHYAEGVAALKAITEAEVREFYWDVYGQPMAIDKLNGRLTAIVLLDQAVNRGKTGVKRGLVYTLNKHFAKSFNDSHLFADYIDTLNSLPDKAFAYRFVRDAQHNYADIVIRDSSRTKELHGWLNRTQILIGYML